MFNSFPVSGVCLAAEFHIHRQPAFGPVALTAVTTKTPIVHIVSLMAGGAGTQGIGATALGMALGAAQPSVRPAQRKSGLVMIELPEHEMPLVVAALTGTAERLAVNVIFAMAGHALPRCADIALIRMALGTRHLLMGSEQGKTAAIVRKTQSTFETVLAMTAFTLRAKRPLVHIVLAMTVQAVGV
jgi:hypothetical protein